MRGLAVPGCGLPQYLSGGGRLDLGLFRHSSVLLLTPAIDASLLRVKMDDAEAMPGAPINLRTDFSAFDGPLSVPRDRVRVSWQHNATAPGGTTQLSYEVEVAAQLDNKPLWSSGSIQSSEQQTVIGVALDSAEQYTWRARAILSSGGRTPWSLPSSFGTAPDPASWHESTCNASWIGGGGQLRSFLRIPAARGTIVTARAHVSGVGAFYMWINQTQVGDHVLDPAQSVYHQRMHYVTFDVADMLLSGMTHELVVLLGNYKWGYLDTWCDMSEAGGPDGCRAFILQLRVTFADGSELTHCSRAGDSGWEASISPVVWDHMWHGETMNGSIPLGGNGSQHEWRPARLMVNASGGGKDDRT